ncbi:hypothetical protein EOD41_13295 [Mucilaginibacter limnophilus]|uniref:Outer membrane protein beta-barrel domain-containing protein n=1 Tax=Mucilaginibacter limnophilus TaxID=1932778 RepID=A0A437MS33_9SPHI|nr:hypothetical protein [Mucilaginibacter limnophilus]RVU00446.1 hypothetical protein EOD41_13295 [Mucilaginibacter limnophilus]
MKRFYLILAVVFLPFITNAQSNYQEGYIIKNNGDSIQGQINVRDWLYNPQSIEFKQAGEVTNTVSLSANDIKKFSAGTDITYISYTGKISKNKNVYPGLDTGLDSVSIINTYFLKQLVSAPLVSLYLLNVEDKTTFFYKEANSQLIELKYYQYYTASNKSAIEKTTPYIYQLIYLAKKYGGNKASGNTSIQRIAYSQKELTKYFEKLNGVIAAKTKQSKSQFFAGVGLNFNQVTPTPFNSSTLTTGLRFNDNKINSISPKLSLGYNTAIIPNTGRYIFRSELSFTYLKAEVKGQHFTPQGKEIKHVYQLNQYTATLSPQFIINLYNTKKFKYFISGGLNGNFSIYPKKQLVFDDGSVLENAEYPVSAKAIWLSFPFQTGAVFNKRIEVSAGYTVSSTFASSYNVSLRNPAIFAGVKYFFGRNNL